MHERQGDQAQPATCLRGIGRHGAALGHRRPGVDADARPLRHQRVVGTRGDLVWEGSFSHGYGDVEGAEFGRQGARHLLDRPDPPTALLTINDMYALGAYAGAQDLGLRVPDAVSIVGFDDIAFAEVAQPPLTTVRQPLREMLQVTVSLLIDRLEGQRNGPAEHLTFRPELIVRASVAPASRT